MIDLGMRVYEPLLGVDLVGVVGRGSTASGGGGGGVGSEAAAVRCLLAGGSCVLSW